MWFGKNIMTKLGLALALAVPAFAADVKDMYPLKFGSLSDELQAQYWNDLMSFKMWGTDRIYFTKVTLTDKVGAVGTAGNFDWTGGAGFELGGPVLVEGDFDGGGQEFFTSGPARINGHMLLSGDKENNTLVGTYCIDGDDGGVTVNSITERACERGNNLVDEEGKPLHCELRTGPSAKTGPCADVKPVPKDLFIPTYPFGSAGATNLRSVSVGNREERFIDIPPVEYDKDGNVTKKMYDYELSSLNLGDGAKFFVRIGSTKSLARFFVNGKITLTSSSTIQVVLVNNGSWDGSKWVGGDTIHVPDTSYAGNLLFYTNDDLILPSMNGKEILLEGTFMSTKTIDIGSNLYLAGQFLAKEIKISNDLHGEGFKYVPFNAPVITASGTDNIIEEGRDDNVNIVLDKTPSTDIRFEYCYYFEGKKNSETDKAIAADVEYVVDMDKNAHASVPIYDPSTYDPTTNLCSGLKPLKSSFKEGSQKLTTPIILHAYADGVVENEYEEFKIWILNLEGAVLETGKHEGPITLKIHDIDGKPKGADITVAGTEDVPYKFDVFNVTNAAGSAVITDYFVKIESLPTAGSLVLIDDKGKSVPVKAKDKISSADIAAGNFVFKFDTDDYTEGPTPDPSKDIERYNFEFRVVDARNNAESKSSYKVLVTVDPVNDAPVASKTVFTIPEKSVSTAASKTYAESEASDKAFDASDVDDPKDALTYKFDDNFGAGYTEENYNHVTSLYGIEENTGKIYVKEGAELDYESTDRELTIRVVITDKSSSTGKDEDIKSTSVEAVIKITDVNEPPVAKDLEVALYEVTPKSPIAKDSVIGQVEAVDPDSLSNGLYDYLEYYLDKNADVPFAVNKLTGEVSVKDPAKLDYEDATIVDHKFVFDVVVKNCVLDATTRKPTDVCLEDVSTVTIELKNVNEPPIVIDSTGDTISVAENSPVGLTKMAYFEVTDPDEEDNANLLTQIVPNITDNKKKSGVVSAEDLFEMVMEKAKDEYGVDKYWAVLKVKADLDFEAIMAARGDSVFDVTLTFTDQAGAGLDTSLAKKIAVTDVNEAPTITGVEDLNGDYKGTKDDFTFYPKEDLSAGGSVGYVHTEDPDILHMDEFGYREFSLDNPNNYPFEMKDSLLVLTKKLDYEKDPKEYTFKVIVNNCERVKNSAGKYEKKNPPKCVDPVPQTVTVKIQDVDEPPKIIPVCEGDKCVEICKGDKCEVCEGDACDEHELCVENCDNPRGDDPAKTLTVTVKENSPTDYQIINYEVRDEDYGVGHTMALTASISNTNVDSGADSLFGVKMVKDLNGDWRVIVYVIDEKKLDYEKINETHEVTIYVYDPQDREGMYDSLLRVIKVVDVNEAPKAEDADFKPEENLPDSAIVGELKVAEPDTKHVPEFGHLEYSIIGKDETFVFAMDSNRVIVNDPSKMDYELPVHFYTFDVLVKNCVLNTTSGKYDGACLYDTATVTVDIQDVNEKPEIIIDGPIPDGGDDSDSLCVAYCDTTGRGVGKDSILTVGVKENTDDSLLSKTGMVLFQYHYVDEDTGHVAGAKVTWFDAGSTISSVSTKGSDLFNIEGKNGVITVTVKDQKLLDYEKLRNATSRDDPDPEYTMGIVVTDPKGLKDTLYRIIRVVDVNEKPLYTAEPCVVVEGNHPGDSIGHVEHPSDIDSLSRNPALYDNQFKMTGGDSDRFELRKDSTDLMRVMLAALDSIDCEDGSYICGVDSVYWVELTYGDTTLKTVYNNIRIPVKVLDLNEPPEFRTDTIGVAENSPKGTVVDTIKWFDWDRFDTTMHFEISNDPSGCFDIDEKTGVVTVKKDNCADLNYEKNPTLKIEVAITDMVDVTDRSLISGGPNTVKKIITVNVHDVNEPPSITDKTITVKEDTKPKTVVDTVRATDPDKNPEYRDLTYTLIGGDTATFKIEPKTGALILKDTLDYETKSSYYVTVRVDDGEFADTAKVKINIGNVKEWSKVKITEAESKRKNWEDPDVIYTNETIHKICWTQDGDEVCKEGLKIAKDTTIIVEWRNPTKDYAGRDTLRIYYSNSIPSVTVTGKKTLVDADNVFTIVEDMGEADTNIYINKSRDSIWVKIKDPASKLDTAIGIEVSLGPVEASRIQGSLDKMTKVADSKIMRDETAKNVVETLVNRNQYKYTYKEIVGKDTVKVSYMTDKDGEPIKVPVINEKGKVDSVEVITVTYTTTIDGKEVEVSYQADALTGEVFVKGPAGELMEQGASKKIYGSDKNTKSGNSVTEGMFTITTGGKDILGNDRVISYAVDKNGKMVKNTEGDVGYSVIYSYMNKYGNVATESVFIVVDQVGPKVEILSPVNKEVVRSNSVKVVWTVDGVEQDTLNLQGLSKGPNVIVRFYRDKAGNEDSAVVYVYMKDSKDVEISVEQPVTEISKDKIEEYYAVNPPEKGETFAVSIRNPTTGEEVETLIGGSFKTKKGSGKEPYPGVSGSSQHLGPTLAMDIKVPVIDGVAGLATLDDLITPDGLIALERTDAKKAHKITVEEYVQEFCEDGFKIPSDVSQVNLFDTKLKAQIWVYTSLGNFVDYFSFTQELNDPNYTDEAGLLKMYFEMKPDKDGFVKADNGKQYATGAFVYKVQATIHSKARCTIPDNTYDPENKKNCDAKERDCDGYGETTKRKGDNIKNSDELLKSFGYRRPKNK